MLCMVTKSSISDRTYINFKKANWVNFIHKLPWSKIRQHPTAHQHPRIRPTTQHMQSHREWSKLNKRSVLVAQDLSKAFDLVNHEYLLTNLLHTTLPNRIKRWLANYLRCRRTYVEHRREKSKLKIVHKTEYCLRLFSTCICQNYRLRPMRSN